MAATLNHTQTRTASVPPAASVAAPYRVVDVVNSSTGFPESLTPGPTSPASVFVFKVSDGLFDHVATVLDMQTYPNSLLAAQTANLPYYRLASVTKDFATMLLGQDFADTLISRMRSLCNEYTLTANTFVGVTGPANLP
jgi:hypothetical protein